MYQRQINDDKKIYCYSKIIKQHDARVMKTLFIDFRKKKLKIVIKFSLYADALYEYRLWAINIRKIEKISFLWTKHNFIYNLFTIKLYLKFHCNVIYLYNSFKKRMKFFWIYFMTIRKTNNSCILQQTNKKASRNVISTKESNNHQYNYLNWFYDLLKLLKRISCLLLSPSIFWFKQ